MAASPLLLARELRGQELILMMKLERRGTGAAAWTLSSAGRKHGDGALEGVHLCICVWGAAWGEKGAERGHA
jgi:hypothetical protein